ncbi:DUF2975 domain-containing protein [Bacillus sp. ISL-35]|uniref:DUF2975 domain-containing protein n=1 Tax=Bacillus sp. ISL-35 TaxID=2819122 RepID=UPI001BEB7134|nr:DUF2975 domain-containing protein [Bacillus sp. ISL-35]MBT2681199.1 DUF2975 domain-containing protein [Bacillus sp. ISL-35]MBT2706110.1 DUF2975 domain-containing protein [Chryseobacterium sp. ISL-80]
MKRETLFLKVVVFLLAVPVLAACFIFLPWLIRYASQGNWVLANFLYPIIGVMYASAVPYFIALYQAFLLLGYIDKDIAFSGWSVKALKNIKFCAVAISILYLAGMPLFYLIGEKDDAPGVILIGMVLTFAPIVIAAFAAVLEKLLKHAIEIKSENDLTV